MPDTAQFRAKLSLTEWARFETAYGSAEGIPHLLVRLAGEDHVAAMKASHDLLCSLCHQHDYLSSAALPALPFLLEVLATANTALATEILDIFVGFALCSGPQHVGAGPWIGDLRQSLLAERARFVVLKDHQDELIVSFADQIVECLDGPR